MNTTEEEVVQLVKIVKPRSKIAIDKLGEENLFSWKFQVLVTLREYGLQDFIEGDDLTPSKNDTADENSASS